MANVTINNLPIVYAANEPLYTVVAANDGGTYRMSVPSAEAIEKLTERIDALEAEIAILKSQKP